MGGDSELCLLLLDGVLEEVPFGRRAQDLLRAPSVVAVEPGRRSPGFMVAGVARRLTRSVPGVPRVLVLIGPRQYALARALLARHPHCELWYGSGSGDEDPLAAQRATLEFDAADDGTLPFAQNSGVWDRLEELGIARR